MLYLVGGASIGSAGILTARNEGDIDKTVSDVEGMANGLSTSDASASMVQEFGYFSPGFEKIEFINLDILRIHFGTHNMDGFGVRHTSLDEIKDDVYVCEAPRSTGTRDVPLIDLLKEEDVVYPNRKFDLVAYEGEFSKCGSPVQVNWALETKGTASFVVPESIAPPSAFRDM